MIIVMTVYAFLMGSIVSTIAQRGEKVRVAVTISFLKPIVYSIVGSLGEIYSIVPEEAEPHGFTLTPSIVRDALNSDLIVVTGHMEWEEELVKQVANEKGVQPCSISLNLLNLTGIKILGFEGERNIHGFWLLPDNAVKIAEALRSRLSELRPEYSGEFSSNLMLFEEQASNLKAFLNRLSEKYGSSGRKVVICFYAEQYVAEAMGLKTGAVLVGEEEIVSPESLSRVYNGLRSGEYACMVASDTALGMSGVQNTLQQISRETGCSIAYVSIVSTNGLEKYDEVMYYNAGQVYSALLSGNRSASSEFNVYLLSTLIALLVIIFETSLLVKWRMRI